MEKRTMILVGGAALLGFLYLRNRSAVAVPATVNAGTAAPVGNNVVVPAGTTNTQTATGSEAAYTATPAPVATAGTLDAFQAALKKAEDIAAANWATIQSFMANNPAQT